MDCRTATEQLLARIDAQAAIDHIISCPRCASRLGALARALATDRRDQLNCLECEELLPGYVLAEREGRAGEAQWAPLRLHLETCPHCSEAWAELVALLEDAYGAGEPSHSPAPDLSFLDPGKGTPARPWHLDELGRLIVEFSAELLRALRPPVKGLGAPQPAYATAGLKSAASSGTLFQLNLPGPVDDLEVTIQAEEERGDPARCTVSVQVDIPSRGGWPHLAGTEVMLKKDERKLDRQWTDAFGEVVFQEIAVDDLARLVLVITPPN